MSIGFAGPAVPVWRARALPGWLAAAAVPAALALVVLPLLLADVPPLLDFPNHLARAHILQHWADDPDLRRWYLVNWHFVPNLGHDLVMALLTPWLPVAAAGRVLLGLIQLVTLAGVALLYRVLWQRWSLWPLAAVPLLWHGTLMAGFTSFSLGLGLSLMGLALWLWLAGRPLWQRAAAGMAMAMVLYTTHLFALALFLVVAGGIELATLAGRPRPWRLPVLAGGLALVLAAAVPLAFFAVYAVHAPDGGVAWGPWNWTARLRGVQMPLMGEDRTVRLALTAGLALLAGGLALTGSVRIAPSLLPGAAILAVLFLVLPGMVLDNGDVPERLSVALALLAVAGTCPAFRTAPVAMATTAALALAALVQSASVGLAWQQAAHWTAGLRQAIQALPPASRLLVAVPWSEGDYHSLYARGRRTLPGWYFTLADVPALVHLPTLAVERGAFVPLLFNHPQKQILDFTPDVRDLGRDRGPLIGADGNVRLWSGVGGAKVIPIDQALAEVDGKVALAPALDGFDHVIVVYAELLRPDQRVRLAALPQLYDDGRILLLAAHRQSADSLHLAGSR
jgi:hypothetical protein